MTVSNNNDSSLIEETDADRRRGVLASNALSLDLVSAYAGDRALTDAEKDYLVNLESTRGLRFYSDLFYSITHQYFAPQVAEALWAEVLQHKHVLSESLGRNVGLVVAALDYLSNITDNMDAATLVGEVYIGEIIGLSLRDGLTGLFNHTYFYQQIDLEVKRFVRYGTPVTLVLIDIDDFKAVNDTYGHREGDKILAAMGKTLLHLARDSDICCRYGGEELAVILPLTTAHEAEAIANRMRKKLAQRLPDGKTVTVSIGVAACGENTATYQTLVEKADAALYQVKKSGKNRVIVAANEEVSTGA
jgi:diguanylate cyclase (GGDEF)-like protein